MQVQRMMQNKLFKKAETKADLETNLMVIIVEIIRGMEELGGWE